MLVETTCYQTKLAIKLLCVEQMGDRSFNRGTGYTAVILDPV